MEMHRRVAFPPLGILSLVAEQYLRALGTEIVTPPPTSRRTLDLGMRGTPEGLCIPCKLLFGNYVEAAERGATEIVMLGGTGTCRLGYSVAQHVQRLRSMGFDVVAHTLDLYHVQQDIIRLTGTFAAGRPAYQMIGPIRFLLDLLSLADELEMATLWVRPRERERGATERAYAAALERLRALRSHSQLREERAGILGLLQDVKVVAERPVLRLGLVGDLYTVLTPFLNQNLELELGRMGVEVRRWFRLNIQISLPLPPPLPQGRGARARQAGSRYLGRDVGGFARWTVAEAALMATEAEVDGLIHVAPFNCAPEAVAHSALVALQRERGTPVLNLSFDEQTGRAGLQTRLEAFVDMLWPARRRKA